MLLGLKYNAKVDKISLRKMRSLRIVLILLFVINIMCAIIIFLSGSLTFGVLWPKEMIDVLFHEHEIGKDELGYMIEKEKLSRDEVKKGRNEVKKENDEIKQLLKKYLFKERGAKPKSWEPPTVTKNYYPNDILAANTNFPIMTFFGPHRDSVSSPYPGTNIKRTQFPIAKIPWSISYE